MTTRGRIAIVGRWLHTALAFDAHDDSHAKNPHTAAEATTYLAALAIMWAMPMLFPARDRTGGQPPASAASWPPSHQQPREVLMYRAPSTPPVSSAVARSVLFSAVLASASAATAFGAMAIARLAIGKMAVKQLSVGRLEIDELTVRRLNVLEKN